MNPSPSSTSVAPTLTALAEPPVRTIDGAAMDYFLIEVVNSIRASSAVAVARTRKVEQEMIDAGLLSPAPPPGAVATKRESLASNSSKAEIKTPAEEEEDAVRLRLESIGTHIGANVAERYVAVFTTLH